jgi:hypothetical protein
MAEAQAMATGTKVRPATFALCSREYELSPGMELPTLDDVFLTGDIAAAMVVNEQTVEFLISVQGTDMADWCRTIGLYLEDGTLFCAAAPAFPAAPGWELHYKIQHVLGNVEEALDFSYISYDQTERDLTALHAQATLGAQTLENARQIGLLRDYMFSR